MTKNPICMGELSRTAKDQIQIGSQCAEAQLVPIDIHQFRRRREWLKLTQTDVTTACGCSLSFISKWENGQRKPSADLHRRLGAFQRRMDEESNPVKATQKRCPKCGRTLDTSCFAKDRSRKSTGLQSKCRKCTAVYVRGWLADKRERVALARKQKSTSKHSRRPTKLVGGRDSPRDPKEFEKLGEKGALKLRKKLPRGFGYERKTAIEKEADVFLAQYPPESNNLDIVCSAECIAIEADKLGKRLRKLRLEHRISEDKLWRDAESGLKRITSNAQCRHNNK